MSDERVEQAFDDMHNSLSKLYDLQNKINLHPIKLTEAHEQLL